MKFPCFFYDPAVAAAAKSHESCPTLSDPMDCSLPGSSIHGIFQARVLEWVVYDIDNLISDSSTFSKSSWYSSKSSVHILLKPSLKDFEHNLSSMRNEHNYMVVCTFFGTVLWNWNETDFYSPVGTAGFSKFAGILSVAL